MFLLMMCFYPIYVLEFHSSHCRCNASHVKQLLKWLQQGNIVVLVRDTGTPVISDPDMEPVSFFHSLFPGYL